MFSDGSFYGFYALRETNITVLWSDYFLSYLYIERKPNDGMLEENTIYFIELKIKWENKVVFVCFVLLWLYLFIHLIDVRKNNNNNNMH